MKQAATHWKQDLCRRLLAAGLMLPAGAFMAWQAAGGDAEAWRSGWDRAPWDRSLASGLEVLVAGGVSFCLAGTLAMFFPGPLRHAGFWLGKTVAFFPVLCLVWGFLGFWVGVLEHPVWSLMPTGEEPMPSAAPLEAWARWIWTWTPAVALASVPLAGQALSLHLEADPHRRRWGWLGFGFLALALLIPLEETLALEGVGSLMMQAFRQPDPAGRAAAVWSLMGTMVCLSAALPFPTRWRLDTLSGWGDGLRRLAGALLKAAAWTVVLLFSQKLLPELDSEQVLAPPLPVLVVAWKPTLCALSLWVLGHIIQPRLKPSPAAPAHG